MTASPASASTLALDGALCIYNALETKERLMTALHASDTLEVDLAGIEELDSAGFQLLVLLKRESLRLGHTLRLLNHSAAVRDVIVFYNMDAYFGDPVVIPADNAPGSRP